MGDPVSIVLNLLSPPNLVGIDEPFEKVKQIVQSPTLDFGTDLVMQRSREFLRIRGLERGCPILHIFDDFSFEEGPHSNER